MKKSAIVTLLVCAMLGNSFVGCGETAKPADLTGYTVVRPDMSDKPELDAALSLKQTLSKLYGTELKIATDFISERLGQVPAEYEILVGDTNRDETVSAAKDLAPKDYVIDFTTDKLVICGGSDAATGEAVAYFIENYCTDTGVIFPKGEKYRYSYAYPNITVAGTPLSRLSFVYDESTMKDLGKKIADTVLAETNTEFAVDAVHSLKLVKDSSLKPGICTISVRNGDFILSAASQAGMERCVDYFVTQLENGVYNGDYAEGYIENIEATLPDISEFDAEKKYFVGETDKDPLTYAVGETVTMEVKLMADEALASCAKFKCVITADDGFSETKTYSGNDGGITVTATCKVAGAIRFRIFACDSSGKEIEGVDTFEGGAVCGFDSIQLGVTEPSDFDDFWNTQLTKLQAVKTTVSMEKIEDAKDGYEAYYMAIDMGGTDTVCGILTYPANAKSGSLKAKLSFQGYGVNKTSPVYADSYLYFSVCAHNMPQNEDEDYYKNLYATTLKGYGFSAEENKKPETVYFTKMILRDVQAAYYLMSNDLWNGKDLEVSGGSQGGFQSAAVAALVPEVTKCGLSIPWLCDIGGSSIGRLKGWRPDYTVGTAYIDTVSFGKRIKCPTTIDAGLGDYTCPPSGTISLYNAMTCEKKLTFTQNRTHGYQPPVKLTYTKESK